ncbi:hypothetical protein EST38_g12881 [Candolleomyces aberdarensis]|uniref:Uncharacterized protein n=1 Tax=Candolleomyces aberdarensis TaxID=2316362 RepID=A0A4Q2D2H4_9AGAR|nr:hypothetical protein EST38_g12881 [Candolleomyces aberdarensis]
MLPLKSALVALLWAYLYLPALAVLVNRTIDDTAGDSVTGAKPIFFPADRGLWKDQTCIDCLINPDVRLVFGNTYTAATYIPELGKMSISMRFNGTAIYVFFVLVNSADPRVIPETQCDFVLDNGPPLSFGYDSDRESSGYKYNQLVYSNTGLPPGDHLLEIVTNNLDHRVYVNFDYAIYTYVVSFAMYFFGKPPDESDRHDDGTGTSATDPSSAQPNNTASSGLSKGGRIGVVVASVLGSILLLLAIAFLFLRYRRGRLDEEEKYVSSDIAPFSHNDWNHHPLPSTFQHPSVVASYSTAPTQEALSVSTTTWTDSKRGVHLAANRHADEQERVRQARQAEINDRLRALQQEMDQLRASSGGGGPQDGNGGADAMTEMREQMERMKREIEALRANQRSEWALGLTDEPPPGYTSMSSPTAVQRVQ